MKPHIRLHCRQIEERTGARIIWAATWSSYKTRIGTDWFGTAWLALWSLSPTREPIRDVDGRVMFR